MRKTLLQLLRPNNKGYPAGERSGASKDARGLQMVCARELVALSCVSIALGFSAPELEVRKPGLVWPYVPRVVPGTKEWARLNGVHEKLMVSDISGSETSKLTTRKLVAACFAYPMLTLLEAPTSAGGAFDMLVEHSNIFRELASREDAGETLTAWLEDHYTDDSKIGPICVFYGLLRDTRFLRLFKDSCLSRICNVCLMEIREAKKLTPEIYYGDSLRCLVIVTILHQRRLVLALGRRTLKATDLPIDWFEHEREGTYVGEKGIEAIVSYARGLK